MSRGIGGYMNLIEADDKMLIYSYCCYNVNHDDWEEMCHKEDGEIFIERESFVEPEIHQKLKRLPSRRKWMVEKKISRDISLPELLEAGHIIVKNASGTWCVTEDGIDMMACKMLFKLFSVYQDTGIVPKNVSFFS